MKPREHPTEATIASLELAGCPEGPVLQPMQPIPDPVRRGFAGWETPLAPWGAFALDSGLSVVNDEGRRVLGFNLPGGGRTQERALMTAHELRDGRISAVLKPLDAEARPHSDRADCREALVSVVFRAVTSRWGYLFGVEGRRRLVLYRRRDDEWLALAAQDVAVPDRYLTLEVELDGDGIRCGCPELGVSFFCTDSTFKRGKAGVRSLNRALVASAQITQTPAQQARERRSAEKEECERRTRAEGVPDAVLVRTFEQARLGGLPVFADFAASGRYDMLIPAEDRLVAMTVDGRRLWEVPEAVFHIVFSKPCGPHGRLLYGCTGLRQQRQRSHIRGETVTEMVNDQMVVIRGADGQVLARRELPPFPETTRQPDFAPTGAAFTGPDGTDIVLREWRNDKGGGGVRLWAYDQNLNPLWAHEQPGAWYGHHWALALHDVDGDGRDELLAGGTLYDAKGNILWVHDLESEMRRIAGAQHYDAVALGRFAGDEESDPVAFLLGGSAGLYVVDGLTGRTRAAHRIGHAQGRFIGKVRADLPGDQILAVTRWGNMGILTLFSGRGERLWTIQPDYVGQGARPVQWPGADTALIWTNTSPRAQALHNGHGRKVRDLPRIAETWGGRMLRDVKCDVARRGTDPTDYLTLTCDGRMHLFGPDV